VGTCIRSIYPKDDRPWNVTLVMCLFIFHVSMAMHACRFLVNLFGFVDVMLGMVEIDAAY
jgi:hypothetical protein